MPMRVGAIALLVVAAELQHPLHVAADAAQRRRRQHALGRAADAQQHVDAGRWIGGRQRAADVAVGDEADARARLAHLGDQRRRGAGDRG